MSYRYDKQSAQRKRLYFAGIVFLIVIFFTPALSFFFDLVERPLASAWERSNKNIDQLSNVFQRFYGAGEIIKENEELKKQIAFLEIDALRTSYLESVLESYQNIEASILDQEEAIPAQVLVRAPRSPADTLVIDRGLKDGVATGNTVVTADNLLIGTISEVFDLSSRVDLLSKKNTESQGVLYPHGESVVLEGYGSSYFAELPRESLVEVGDTVYSQFESGRLIAVVREVVFDPRDPFKKVYLSAPVDVKNIQTVGVVKES